MASSDELIRIVPFSGFSLSQIRELWRFRELAWMLALRDIAVRYKHAVLGIGWAVLQPVLTMVVFSVVFGRLGKLPSEGLPYAVFAFAALLPWQLFSACVSNGALSLTANSSLIGKIYFPRLLVPLSTILPALLDFVVAASILLVLLPFFKIGFRIELLWLPAFLVLALVASAGVAIWMAALCVRFRDVKFIVPFLVQIWMFASPVAYSSSLVPEKWRLLYGLNPIVGVIDGFRWSLLGTPAPAVNVMLASTLGALLVLVSGVAFFCSTEQYISDTL